MVVSRTVLLTPGVALAFSLSVLMRKLKCTAKRAHCVKRKNIDNSSAASKPTLIMNSQSSAEQLLSCTQLV